MLIAPPIIGEGTMSLSDGSAKARAVLVIVV